MTRFRYSVLNVFGLAILPIIGFIVVTYVDTIAIMQSRIIDVVWLTTLLLAMAWVVPTLAFSISSIRLSETGISSYFFGFRTQHYLWRDVKRIKKVKTTNWSRPNEYVYIIRDEAGQFSVIYNAFGIVAVSNLIESYETFKNSLNEKAASFNIPLAYVDQVAALAQPTKVEQAKWKNVGVPVERI
jgi:hypothetical protein